LTTQLKGSLFPPLRLFREAASGWSSHNAPRLGAALAYYMVLSLAPLVILAVAILGHVFGPAAIRGDVYWDIRDIAGSGGAEFVETLLESASKPATGAATSLLGFAVLLFGASGVFVELHDTLNFIWNAPTAGSDTIRGILRYRIFSFAIVIAIGLLMVFTLGLSAAIQLIAPRVIAFSPASLKVAGGVSIFAVTALLFALIYRYIPDVPISWAEVATGSIVTAILFTAGKILIGIYIAKAAVGSAYGAAGSLVALLVWTYYSAQVFLYGAEFTYVHARFRRSATKHASTQVHGPPGA
jgi:membrane protein